MDNRHQTRGQTARDSPPSPGLNAVDPGLRISMAVHELRTPLQSIQAFLSVVLRGRAGPLTPVQEDFLSSAMIASRRLERLINDVHVMFSLDTDFPIEREYVDLLMLVESSSREIRPSLTSREAELMIDADRDDDWRVWADPGRMEQVILNLLENAVHYCEPETTIRARLRQSRSRTLCVIENDAVAVTGDNPASWFTPFVRGNGAQDLRPEGWGLGLAIVHHLVRSHGGNLFVSVRNPTVSIGFTLPRRATEASSGTVSA